MAFVPGNVVFEAKLIYYEGWRSYINGNNIPNLLMTSSFALTTLFTFMLWVKHTAYFFKSILYLNMCVDAVEQ